MKCYKCKHHEDGWMFNRCSIKPFECYHVYFVDDCPYVDEECNIITDIDCNNCIHLNIKEKDQIDKRQDHICTLYSKRLCHRDNKVKHDAKIFPCRICMNDDYLHYEVEKERK